MHPAGLILGALIVLGLLLGLILRALGSRLAGVTNAATALLVRVTIALFTGVEAVDAAQRDGWFFWAIATLLGLISLFSAALAVVLIWMFVFHHSELHDDPEHLETDGRA